MGLRFRRTSVLERAAEGEQHQALLIVRLRIERLPELDAQRPHGRQPAYTGPGREAGVVERDRLVGPVRIAGVHEDDALQPDRLDEGEDDLVVEDDLLAAPDRRRGDHPPEGVLGVFARPERARLVTADGVDTAREVPLQERKIVSRETSIADAVAEGATQGVGEVAERLRVQERVVPAITGLELHEALAPEARDLE